MSHHNTAFHQLLKPVCRHEFEALAREHHHGQKLRSASRWDQFLGMTLSQVSGRQSLRDIESNLLAQHNKLYHLGGKPIARTTLARLNERQPHELYQALFGKLLARCQTLPGQHRFRFRHPLYSLDASLIDLSLKLFPWAHSSSDKASVKLNVGLNHDRMIPEFVAVSDGKQNDMVAGRAFNFPKGSIVAFDKGYVDYGWYKSLTDKGVFFVTRLRPNSIYEVIERRDVVRGQGVTSDQIIQLNSAHALKRGAPRLRRVGFRCPDTGRHYVFLTNHFTLSARTIADIYKDRWQVELFFKAIKQNLKIKAFVGTSRNAILTQLWIALCTYLLLSFARHSARTGWTVQRIMRVLQGNLFEKKSLRELLDPEPPDKKIEPQMRLYL
ncbi:MAG: IS4 family transposase [Methylomonas sp.]|nr:MAG: IS4 family transposase [Methylomonas sp.]